MKSTIRTLILVTLVASLPSCKDREEERRQKEIKAAEACDKQHDKAMKEASQGNFPEPNPAGPIR